MILRGPVTAGPATVRTLRIRVARRPIDPRGDSETLTREPAVSGRSLVVH